MIFYDRFFDLTYCSFQRSLKEVQDFLWNIVGRFYFIHSIGHILSSPLELNQNFLFFIFFPQFPYFIFGSFLSFHSNPFWTCPQPLLIEYCLYMCIYFRKNAIFIIFLIPDKFIFFSSISLNFESHKFTITYPSNISF